MKKRSVDYSSKTKLKKSIFFFVALLVVVLIALYFSFRPTEIQLSPDEGIGLDNAKSILNAIGPQGINWYCGKVQTITDGQGNTYGSPELQKVREVLQNQKAICGTKLKKQPNPAPTAQPTTKPTQQPTQQPTQPAIPKPSASASASASASPR